MTLAMHTYESKFAAVSGLGIILFRLGLAGGPTALK